MCVEGLHYSEAFATLAGARAAVYRYLSRRQAATLCRSDAAAAAEGDGGMAGRALSLASDPPKNDSLSTPQE